MELANKHWMQARASQTIGALDAAYVDYLLSCTILAEIIPQCPEYPTFKSGASQSYREYETFRKMIGSKTEEFEKIKQAIIKDNEASGVLSTDQQLAADVSAEYQSQSSSVGGGIRRSNARKPDVHLKPDFLRHKQSASREVCLHQSTRSVTNG